MEQLLLPGMTDFKMIWPLITVALFLLMLIVTDITGKRGTTGSPAAFSIFGAAVAAYFNMRLWAGLSGTTLVFGGMVAADRFALLLNFIFIAGFALSVLLTRRDAEAGGYDYSEYYFIMMAALAGMMMMVSAGNLLTVFIGIETLSIALYILVGMARGRIVSAEASLKYLLLGSLATGFLIYGIALVYGMTGTLDMQEISGFYALSGTRPGIAFEAGMLLIAAGVMFKASLAPFHIWAPDVYEGAPSPVAAFMSTCAKAAAFGVLARLLWVTFGDFESLWRPVIYVSAALTMTLGNLGALRQTSVKRTLAYSSVVHAGYIAMALVAGRENGGGALMYYLIGYLAMNAGAFGVVAVVGRGDRSRETFDGFAGLAARAPFMAAVMALFVISLAGIPPTVGFAAKFFVFMSVIKAGYLPLAIIGAVNAVLSVWYYLRIVVFMYMKEPRDDMPRPEPSGIAPAFALMICAAATVAAGVFPSIIMDVIRQIVDLM